MDSIKEMEKMARRAKLAASGMANLSPSLKKKALVAMAKAIEEKALNIKSKNRIDLKKAKEGVLLPH